MQIEYLTKYEANKTNNGLKRGYPKGITISDIEVLELELNNGNAFPKAFREYLYIGGKWNAIGIQHGYDMDGNYTGLQEYYNKRLAERGTPFTRPYIVFDNFEGEVFGFIYLDVGDNPAVWYCSVNPNYDQDDGTTLWQTPRADTFSGCIDDYVYRALNGLPSS